MTVEEYYRYHLDIDNEYSPFVNRKCTSYSGGRATQILADLSLTDMYKTCFNIFEYYMSQVDTSEKIMLAKPVSFERGIGDFDEFGLRRMQKHYSKIWIVSPMYNGFGRCHICLPEEILQKLNYMIMNKELSFLQKEDQYCRHYIKTFGFDNLEELIMNCDMLGITHCGLKKLLKN